MLLDRLKTHLRNNFAFVNSQSLNLQNTVFDSDGELVQQVPQRGGRRGLGKEEEEEKEDLFAVSPSALMTPHSQTRILFL